MNIHDGAVADTLVGDCLENLRTLPDGFANCCVTSPPYFGLRDYGHDGQIGLEEAPEQYIERLVEVFREVRRVLRDDGTLWLNIGDSYANDTKWGGSSGGKHVKALHGDTGVGRGKKRTGLKSKDLIGIPWMLAFALRADGWYLRQDIIWHKPNPMPESVRDRCTKAHEYVFLLSKSPSYFYDHEAVKEPVTASTVKRMSSGSAPAMGGTKYGEDDREESRTKSGADYKLTETRNRRSVWTVAPRPFNGAHFAVYPPELIEPCIQAGCPRGGMVIDPFGGSGTTAGVALANGRNALLFELNPEYAAIVPSRIESILRALR
jgi:DNA modification methylase